MELEKSFHESEDLKCTSLKAQRCHWEQQVKIFGFQNGVPEKGTANYAAAVLNAVTNKTADWHLLEKQLLFYQSAVDFLPEFQTTSEASLLKFEEDVEVHLQIQKMLERERIEFSLFYFHEKSVEDIARILKEDKKLVRNSISKSLATLTQTLGTEDEKKTLKRLELARKSYLRISFPYFEQEDEKPLVQEEGIPIQPEKRAFPHKKPKIFLFSASFLLAGLLGLTFFMHDPNSDMATQDVEAEEGDSITPAMIENWQERYEKARSSSPERLGLELEVFNRLEYVKEADELREWMFSESNIKELENDPEEVQRLVDVLLLKIESPREMLGMLQELYLVGDELEQVIDDYSTKTTELMMEGNEILKEHRTELADVNTDGAIYQENVLMQHASASDEVKKLIGSLPERGLTVIKHPADERFILRRNMEISYGLDQLTGSYTFHLFQSEPYFDGDGLLVPVEEMAYALPTLEYILIEEEVASKKFDELAHVFQHAFWLLLKGDLNQQVFDEHGIVRENYQQAWKDLGRQTHNPLLFVMLPILEEMEASGWTESESYNQLSYSDIMDALLLEKDGKLSEKLPNSDVAIETEHVSAEDFFSPAIEKLYVSFAEGFERDKLRGVTPLDVFRLFQYANQQQDPVLMWHLMTEDKPSLEEYVKGWRQQPNFAEQIRYMNIPKEALQRIGKNLYIYPDINYLKEESIMMYQPELVTVKNHIWEVRSHLYEMYDLTGNAEAFKKKIGNLYVSFSSNLSSVEISTASPGEIGALFLLAAEKKNYGMVKALTSGDQKQSIEILEAQLETKNIPMFSDTALIKFSNETNRNYTGDFSSGFLWFQASEGAENEMFYNQLDMVKTPSGWRIRDLNMY